MQKKVEELKKEEEMMMKKKGSVQFPFHTSHFLHPFQFPGSETSKRVSEPLMNRPGLAVHFLRLVVQCFETVVHRGSF